jgi:hypothetical protein
MRLRRAFPLVLALAVLPFGLAAAQLGGIPESPGVSPGAGSPFGQAPQHGPPPVCQHLITARDETQKYGHVLSAAGRHKAPPQEICKLFRMFIAAEARMVKGLEEHSATCGVPADTIKQVKAQHLKVSQMAKQVCDVAAQGATPRFDAPAPQCTETTLRPGVPCVD